jgi:hypothetical protein
MTETTTTLKSALVAAYEVLREEPGFLTGEDLWDAKEMVKDALSLLANGGTAGMDERAPAEAALPDTAVERLTRQRDAAYQALARIATAPGGWTREFLMKTARQALPGDPYDLLIDLHRS